MPDTEHPEPEPVRVRTLAEIRALQPAHRGIGQPVDVMSDCVFCQRIGRREYDLDLGESVVFEPLNPVTPGHLLVVPVIHVADAADTPYITGMVMEEAAELAQEVGPCNLITSVGREATQSVFHLHIHVVPRRAGDGLYLPWTNQQRAAS